MLRCRMRVLRKLISLAAFPRVCILTLVSAGPSAPLPSFTGDCFSGSLQNEPLVGQERTLSPGHGDVHLEQLTSIKSVSVRIYDAMPFRRSTTRPGPPQLSK